MIKTISLCFLIITIFIASTNALILRPKHLSLDAENHKVAQILNHKLSQLMHLQEGEDLNGPTQDFMSFLMQDPDIMTAIVKSKPLSDASTTKVKTYLIEHPQIIDSFLPTDDDSTSKCLQSLNKEQKQKLYGWVLDGIDIKNMFAADAQISGLSKQNQNDFVQKALADPQLGPVFVKCAITSPSN